MAATGCEIQPPSLSCYIPLLFCSKGVYHILLRDMRLLRGGDILLKHILIVPRGSQTESPWLWKEGESHHLGGIAQQEARFIEWSKENVNLLYQLL